MINLNEIIEITATGYLTQFSGNTSKYYNADFFVILASLKKIYLNKYATKGYYIDKQSFKVVIC